MTTSSSTSPSHRTLHLVDLENLVGDPRADARTALATLDTYLELAHWHHDDHVILASNPALISRVMYDLPVPASVHCARGDDGADVMLLSLAPIELVAKRYARLVIGSGDGIFAARAAAVRERGVAVDVVARAAGCSRRLHQFGCTYLPSRTTDIVLAA
ncbi:MAG TPA: NYN domain-containing protein [Acidimicrobiia bacterium]|nr:NYN domain-containing protein [Acidimicrobiia bacterium]